MIKFTKIFIGVSSSIVNFLDVSKDDCHKSSLTCLIDGTPTEPIILGWSFISADTFLFKPTKKSYCNINRICLWI